MVSRPILEIIQEKLSGLKRAELRVAKFVLSRSEDIVNFSITELATEVGVSDPTVIRFCRKMGLKGYTDLRLSLARDLPANSALQEAIRPEDNYLKILHKSFHANIESLQKTITAIDPVTFERIVARIAVSQRICFYAFGGSGSIAKDAHHKFCRLGLPCEVYTDAHMQFINASLLDEKSTVIVISIKGSTKDLAKSVNIARSAGAVAVGVIGSKMSPLGKECDMTVTFDVDEAAGYIYPFAARISQLAFLDALYLSVTMADWGRMKGNLTKVKKTLSHRNY